MVSQGMTTGRRGLRRALCWAALAAAASFGVTATGAAAQSDNVPGVTAKTVKLGYIFSETGVAGSTGKNAGKAFQARIDRQNAQGGVNGRKIETEIIDDASSGANLTGAQDLVSNRNVFMVVDNSAFAFLTYRYLLSQGVPMIGCGCDGNYYGQKGNENIFSITGNSGPFTGLAYDNVAKVMKQLGATKTAGLGYGASASSSASVKTFQGYAAPAQGLKAVYTNTSVDFGTSDVGPLVLGIKNAGADAAYLPMVASTDLAIVQGLEQNGVTMKANLLATGYGQDLLDSPAASTLKANTVFFQTFKPVELKDKATKQFQADLKKYAGLSGVPDYGQYTGYIAAELAILGLQHAGKTPTRQGFADGLRKLGTYNQAGLSCKPIDLSSASFGKYPETGCGYFMQVKNDKFVVYNKGKPLSGKLVGSPQALEANATGNPDLVTTTTTAAP
jgi:ABC-type branched-subunit amino acid transport system substrate-binding protein